MFGASPSANYWLDIVSARVKKCTLLALTCEYIGFRKVLVLYDVGGILHRCIYMFARFPPKQSYMQLIKSLAAGYFAATQDESFLERTETKVPTILAKNGCVFSCNGDNLSRITCNLPYHHAPRFTIWPLTCVYYLRPKQG